MRLKELSFKNNRTGLNVKNLHFERLTLLVGASGVGKTQILKAIQALRSIAKGNSINGFEWNVVFVHNEQHYIWEGAFKLSDEVNIDYFELKNHEYPILRENLSINGTEIILRTQDKLLYEGKETVKLDPNKSVIELLKEEEIINPIYKGWKQLSILDNNFTGIRISPFINKTQEQIKDIPKLKENKFLSPLEKLFLLRKNELEEFDEIVKQFITIFPTVEAIDFTTGELFNKKPYPILQIKEKDVDEWILQNDISAGMRRTLSQITELVLAEDGDVFLIDEFENGLGVNCINELADMIINPDNDIQFIITSHHPYIINNIPFNRWKIVTREKSNIEIHTAKDLNIGDHSHHDAFMQLVQNKAYQTGRL